MMDGLKGIVHFEINFWYVLAHFKGIQDVCVFVSTVFSILIFLGQTVLVCQLYNGGLWGPPWVHLKEEITRGKNYINTVSFLTQTAHFLS